MGTRVVDYKYQYKVIIAGEPETGKDAIITRFCKDEFLTVYTPTIGVDYHQRYVQLAQVPCKVSFWALSGQERFSSVVRSYFRGANGVLFVFDLTRLLTFENVKKWLAMSKEMTDCCKLLIGTKKDLEQDRQVSEESAVSFAEENGMEYIEVSAKDGTNVEEACIYLLHTSHQKFLAETKIVQRVG